MRQVASGAIAQARRQSGSALLCLAACLVSPPCVAVIAADEGGQRFVAQTHLTSATSAAIPSAADASGVSNCGRLMQGERDASLAQATAGRACARPTHQQSSANSRPIGHSLAPPEEDTVWAQVWVKNVVRAILEGDTARLSQLAKFALKQSPSARTLAASGAGFLVKEKSIWSSCPGDVQEVVSLTLTKWKDAAASADKLVTLTRPSHPLGMRHMQFLSAVRVFEAAMQNKLPPPPLPKDIAYQTAALFAVQGFVSWHHLDSAELDDMGHMTKHPAVLAAARRCISQATEEVEASRAMKRRKAAVPTAFEVVPTQCRSAVDVATGLMPAALKNSDEQVALVLEQAGLQNSVSDAPAAQIAAWSAARENGVDVIHLLRREHRSRTEVLVPVCSTCSGLRTGVDIAASMCGPRDHVHPHVQAWGHRGKLLK